MTPAERYAALLAYWDGLERADPDSHPAEYDPAEPIVLVEKSIYDQSIYITTHADLSDAASYRDSQEYPEDWTAVHAYDCATGEVYDAETKTTFVDAYRDQWTDPAEPWKED